MDYYKILDIGLGAAESALEIIESEKHSFNKIEKNLSKDVKVFADIKSEKVIIEYLEKSTDFSILCFSVHSIPIRLGYSRYGEFENWKYTHRHTFIV